MSTDHVFLKLDMIQTASPDRIFKDLEAFQAEMIEAIVVGDPERLHVRPSPWDFAGNGTAPFAMLPQRVVGRVDTPASGFATSDIDELLALRRLAKSDPADDHERLPPKLPDHPGFDASLADWTAWYYEVDEKDPSLKLKDLKGYSFDELKEVAKFKLIKQGTKYATDQFKDVLKKWLTDELSVTPNIPDVLKQLAADGDIAGDWLDEVKKAWDELENSVGKSLETVGGYLSDPSKLLDLGVEQFFKNGLPALADFGLKEFFGSIWGVDENSPAFERVAHKYSEFVVQGIVDDLLKDISSLADLKKNWSTLGGDLKAKIKKFYTGESFDAKLPAARLLDKDSAVDRVFSGLTTVKAGGLDLARATDIMFPSALAIVDGSGTVLAGSLPVARVRTRA